MKTESHRYFLTFILILNAITILYSSVFSIILRKQCENKRFQLGVFGEFYRE